MINSPSIVSPIVTVRHSICCCDLLRPAPVRRLKPESAKETSPNSRNSGRRSLSSRTSAPIRFANEHSASATAKPPSPKSCADSARFSPTNRPNRVLNPLLQIHVELRGKSPQRLDDVLCVLGAAEMDVITLPEPAEQHDRAASLLEMPRPPVARFPAGRRFRPPASGRSPRRAFRYTDLRCPL